MHLKKIMLVFLTAASCSIIVQSCSQHANAESAPVTLSPETVTVNYANNVEINWNNLETITSKVKAEPKKVLIDVYTDWCKWCKVMDKQTFSDPAVVTYLNENYHMVKLNAEQKSKIQFKGNEYTFIENGRRGYNQVAAELLQGKLSFPSLVVLDQELNTISIISGFQSPEKLLQTLQAM